MKQLREGLVVLMVCIFVAAGCSSDESQDLQALVESEVSDAIKARGYGPPTLSIVAPVAGAVVQSPFEVRVQARNLALAPSGSSADGEGHFHIRINEGCVDAGTAIPKNDQTLHVGSGGSSSQVELSQGRYQLCAQIGDGFHVAVNVFDTVEILVVE